MTPTMHPHQHPQRNLRRNPRQRVPNLRLLGHRTDDDQPLPGSLVAILSLGLYPRLHRPHDLRPLGPVADHQPTPTGGWLRLGPVLDPTPRRTATPRQGFLVQVADQGIARHIQDITPRTLP